MKLHEFILAIAKDKNLSDAEEKLGTPLRWIACVLASKAVNDTADLSAPITAKISTLGDLFHKKLNLLEAIGHLRRTGIVSKHDGSIAFITKKPPKQARMAIDADCVGEVFEHWRKAFDKPRAKLDAKRRKLIANALKLGYSVDDLKQAVDGCGCSSFHQGKNDRGIVYNGLELILRNADKIDNFMSLASQNKPKGANGAVHWGGEK